MNKGYKYSTLLIMILLSRSVTAQNNLLNELEEDNSIVESFNYPAFKAMKIANLQSTKVAEQGDLYMYVSHRFGTLKDGTSTFFGLDNANTKLQLIYGLFDGLQLGLSRESLRKTYAGSVKLKLLQQNMKNPVNVTAYATININSQLEKKRYPELVYYDRISYTSQLLISRRFTNQFSLLIAPSYIRQNFVIEPNQQHNQLALASGGRFKVSKRVSINLDYSFNFNRLENSIYKDPLTVGMDIETGGHVFQLLFSNAQSTNEPGFMSNAEGNWEEGNIFFGFNIVRVF